jgi:hypothetical protein
MQGGTDGGRGLAEGSLVPEDREGHHAGHHPHGAADQGGEAQLLAARGLGPHVWLAGVLGRPLPSVDGIAPANRGTPAVRQWNHRQLERLISS